MSSPLKDTLKASSKKKKKTVQEDSAHNNVSNGTVSTKSTSDFLPYSFNVITPEIAQYAAKNLNETEETRVKALKELRELLQNDSDLVYNDQEELFFIFLRSRKFDAKRSYEFFKLGLNYVESYRYILERKDPAILRRVIQANMVGFLPYRDPEGRAIIYSRADAWDHTTIPAADAIFGGVIAVQSAAYNPVNQIKGFVIILDLKDLKIQQVVAMSRWMIFGAITLQRACPCFMKAFHVINVPPIYKIGWKLVKPLLSEKIKKRFIFHKSSDLSTLYEFFPREILPPELGGAVPFSNDHWARDIDFIEATYYDQLKKTYLISKRKT